MSVKILGGIYKGRSLEVPREGTRPTSVLLRRRLFDALQSLDGYYFVDLCAGSGAMGIEALSRGANKVSFVDLGKKQIFLIKKNLEKILDEKNLLDANLFQESSISWLRKNSSYLNEKSIIFFDPPYNEEDLYLSFIDEIKNVNPEVLFLIEVSNKTKFYENLKSRLSNFKIKIIKQGEKEIFWF